MVSRYWTPSNSGQSPGLGATPHLPLTCDILGSYGAADEFLEDEAMDSIRDWNWVLISAVLAGFGILIVVYQVVESSEGELRADMQRMETELKAEMRLIEAERKTDMQRFEAELAALSVKLDQFIERVDARLDEVEREQARLDAVNELLVQQIQQR